MGRKALSEKDFNRLKGFLITLLETTGNNVFCLGYEKDKDYINELQKTGLLGKSITKFLKQEGFCLKRKDGSEFLIFYNDFLKTHERIKIFAHESGHGLLCHPETEVDNPEKIAQQEWEADFFSAAFLFIADGALAKLKTWNRKAIYTKIEEMNDNG